MADTTFGEASDGCVESLAGWEDIVGVQGVPGDFCISLKISFCY